jgi:uncharacterized protein
LSAMKAAKAAILALPLCWAFAASAQVAVPPLTGRVVDRTATLSGNDVALLQQTIRSFELSKGSQLAVLMAAARREAVDLEVGRSWSW